MNLKDQVKAVQRMIDDADDKLIELREEVYGFLNDNTVPAEERASFLDSIPSIMKERIGISFETEMKLYTEAI